MKTTTAKQTPLLCLLLLFFTVITILCDPFPVSGRSTIRYVTDDAGLLTGEEISQLNEQCKEISSKHHVTVCIVTTPDFQGDDIKDWQRSYFSQHELGTGDQESGIMLAISMAERDWGLVGFGDAIPAFTTYGRERIGELIVGDLSDGEYYDAFEEYISLADQFLTESENGTPYDSDHTYKETVPIPLIVGISILLSFVIALIVVLSWKRSMNTRISQDGASEYLEQDSFTLTKRSDLFLYHTVSRTRKPQENHQIHMDSDSSGTSGKF